MKLIESRQLDELAAKAKASPRGRAHLTLHTGNEDRVQRFFVAADSRTYFRPHRHRTRTELALVVRGSFELLGFDDEGTLRMRHVLDARGGALAYETPMDLWHALLALEDGSIFLEVKEGPYDPATAADLAPWAPAEGSADVTPFQRWLRCAMPGDRFQ
jgi:cupin fold WbuC family metalloprotein